MKSLNYLILAIALIFPINSFSGEPINPNDVINNRVDFVPNFRADEEVFAPYDLRDRKTYIQVTRNSFVRNSADEFCMHVQIFQHDKGCDELDFEDTLTLNDTVIYDMDNLIRNDGSEVPVNLADDSYGYVAFSAYNCNDLGEEEGALLGNVRIVDDSGYEYRTNLVTNTDSARLLPYDDADPDMFEDPDPNGLPLRMPEAFVVIPFNTVDGANQSDIFAFVYEDNRSNSGIEEVGGSSLNENNVYNEENGISFDVFQIDENEERLSCDRKTIGCGPNIEFNYGINEDYPNSKGGPLLCEGGGLLEGQTHGYISLENPSFLSSINSILLDENEEAGSDFEFVCFYGMNNGNGTGSMDMCQLRCTGTDRADCRLEANNPDEP